MFVLLVEQSDRSSVPLSESLLFELPAFYRPILKHSVMVCVEILKALGTAQFDSSDIYISDLGPTKRLVYNFMLPLPSFS